MVNAVEKVQVYERQPAGEQRRKVYVLSVLILFFSFSVTLKQEHQ
jgi:hypothetical protein